MDIFTLHRGTAPLLVSLPHDGHEIPAELSARMVETACRAPDTDWHVSRLYAFARELGASMIVPRYSRYVVDLNRPPDDTSLYPGQNTTGLCPTKRFDGGPAGVDNLAAAIGEARDTIEDVIEPYLIQQGYLMRTPRGRIAGRMAYQHYGLKPPRELEARIAPDLFGSGNP